MLTPVDIQQKKFKSGFGYDKKDVNAFFAEVLDSYSQIYRSNAEFKERVITLTDTVQHYKTTEEDLQKSLMLAEKSTEETRQNAEKNAKAMELEAKNRAAEIVKDAQASLTDMQAQLDQLKAEYASYRQKFIDMSREAFQFLKVHDFDADAYLNSGNPFFTGMSTSASVSSDEMNSALGYGEGGAQDGASALGSGISKAGSSDVSNSSNVYGTTLGGEGIDPFKALSGEDEDPDPTPKQKPKNTVPLHTKKSVEDQKDEFDDDFKFM